MFAALLILTLFLTGMCIIGFHKADQEMNSFLIILAFITAMFAIAIKKDEIHRRNLTAWVLENITQIRIRGSTYNGVYIDRETEFMQYELCFSWVLFSYRSKSSYYIKDYHPTPMLSLLFSGFCLVFGWSALPRGPIYTFLAIKHNLFSKPKRLDIVVREMRSGS